MENTSDRREQFVLAVLMLLVLAVVLTGLRAAPKVHCHDGTCHAHAAGVE